MSEERIHYLDWLKVLIVYGIVLFHVCLVFAVGTWLVSNNDRSIIVSAFTGFCFPWGIPAMFLLAGADAWFALRSHGAADFIRRRFWRLLVPMLPGLIVLSPLQRFVTSQNPPPSIDRLPAYYLAFFRGFQFDWDLQWVSRYWLHLWFLGYLFAISLVCVPVLIWMRTAHGRRWADRMLRLADRPGGLYLLALPLALSQLILRPYFAAYQGWADVATYLFVFVVGALIFSDRRFEALITRQIGWLLTGGLASVIGFGALYVANPTMSAISGGGSGPVQVGESIVWSVFIWSWLLAVINLGIRWLNRPHPALAYLEESILPVYVIHHPYVLLVASFVVTWPIGLWPKFAVVLVAVASLTMATYEFGVRRWNAMRLLFGLKPRPQQAREPRVPIRMKVRAG